MIFFKSNSNLLVITWHFFYNADRQFELLQMKRHHESHDVDSGKEGNENEFWRKSAVL